MKRVCRCLCTGDVKIIYESRFRYMTKKKKVWISICGVLIAVFLGLVCVYFIYGSMLINGYSEETIINDLSDDMNNPVEIFAVKKYEDHLGVAYKDPSDDNPYDDYVHFGHYIRHSLYKNRYYYKGGSEGNVNGPSACVLSRQEAKLSYFIADELGREDDRCIVYETDAMGNTVRKLDEFDVPKNTPYILVKEYELLHIYHSIDVCNASRDYPREFNENYIEADKEWFNMIKSASGEKEQKKTEELYKEVFGEE